MAPRTIDFHDVDSYIAHFPEDVQKVLQELRKTIGELLPEAEEAISYQIPAFRQNDSYIVYFGGFKKHIAVYPAPVEHPEMKNELAPYASGRGTVKFSLDEPLPHDVIRRIVEFNAEANEARAASRKKKKKGK